MTKYTPGPWTADSLNCVWRGGPDINGVLVANCNNSKMPTAAHPEQATANARLIAAAPDLLAALQELVAEEDGDFHNSTEGFNMARAAIAKARAD